MLLYTMCCWQSVLISVTRNSQLVGSLPDSIIRYIWYDVGYNIIYYILPDDEMSNGCTFGLFVVVIHGGPRPVKTFSAFGFKILSQSSPTMSSKGNG